MGAGHAFCAEVDLAPVSTADGQFTQVTVAGESVWQNTGTSGYLYFRRPTSFAFTPGQTLYVRVTYFDGEGGGKINLHYDSPGDTTQDRFKPTQIHTRTSRVGSGVFVDGYHELSNVLFSRRTNGSDFRVICGAPGGVPVSVKRVTLSDTPFANPDFQLAVARAWQSRHTGPAKDYVDATSLKGKVMTGYQGWFGTPNDIADTGGWKHWVRNGAMIPENFTIDAWPDLTEYDPASLARAANVMTASGAPAYLFSSRNYSAVQKHFRWMRKHNIDGAWLQRFHPKAGAESEWVLRNVSQAAAEEGLVWGVEYDVSGMADATVAAKLQADWEWLTTQFDILNDPRYIHEDGKPVVFIWGLAVPDRNFTTASANAAVDWFKAQGAYVIGGLPTNWNKLDAGWQTHMAKYDGVLVWQNTTPSDATLFRNRGQDFYPHVWPGFSWAHLKMLSATPLTQYTDRSGGQFFWTKGRDWINAGTTDSLFFGMWDEYDEATHTMPMTDDPPPPHTEWGRFINNQGKPADWWMMLADELKRMMLKQRTNTNTLPTVESLANRSNIGAEASVDLGATDPAIALSRVENPDSNTIVETVGGRECRGNATPASTHRFMDFNVHNDFAFQLANGDVTIEVEYFDSFYGSAAGTVLGLQYDGSSNVPTNHPQSITTTNSGTWRRVRFEIADAWFGDRQNGGADFRLNFNGKKLNVNRVWVRLPEGKAYPFTWNNATAGPALNWSQNANWLGGIVGQSDPTSVVRFFPNQTMPGGTIPISNNLSGQQFGTLQLGGTASSSADTTVTLSGDAFSLGGTAPAITQDAMKSAFDFTYDITTPITLLATTQIGGSGNAGLRISGQLGGGGGLVKSSAGTLTLSATNTFSGGTQVSSGTLVLGHATDTLPDAGAVTVSGGTLDIAGNNDTVGVITLTGGSIIGSGGTLTGSAYDLRSGSVSARLGGFAGLTKNTADTLTLTGANTFSGGANLRNGTVESRTTQTTLGTGTATMGGSGSSGVTYLTGQPNSNPFIINAPDSGTIVIGSNGVQNGFTLSGPITLNGDLTLQTFPNTGTGIASSANFTGGITGTGNLLLNNFGTRANFINLSTSAINHSGSITVQGQGTGNVTISANIGPNVTAITQNSATSVLVLSGANNTFSGNTTVNTGTLRITQAANPANANPGNDASTVTIAATGASLNLTYSGTDKVDKLFIGSTQMPAGVYGTSATAIPQITGNGTLTVATGPPFEVWITGPFTNGQVPVDQRGPNDDFDNDGIRNLIEYAIAGQDPTVANSTVGSFTANSLSFSKRPGTSGLTYAIEQSTDLGVDDLWDEVEGDDYVNDPATISYPIVPGTPPRNFLRLKVIEAAASTPPLPL
jgi:autotransporter-associated beta strand protein